MTGEQEAIDSPSPFDVEAGALPKPIPGGLKITIADILFCMFAVALCLMTHYQQWGGFEGIEARRSISGILTALGASIFFTANRTRRANNEAFFSQSPGFYLALLYANHLVCDAFQFLVSFLDTRHVGDPIHVLAELSPYLGSGAISLLTLWRVNLSTRWQAVFVGSLGCGLFNGASLVTYYFASNSDLNDPFNVASAYLWRLTFAVWILASLFLMTAYAVDLVARIRREWWHHSIVILELLGMICAFYEDPELIRFLQRLYYQYLNYW